jgi:hypothetical protein
VRIASGAFLGVFRTSRYRLAVELRQLEAFAAVAAELHFGRAAERMHLAAPTLSELIRRLERELGTPLFTRTTRRVALTSAGAELLTRSKVILEEVAAARAAVRRVAEGEAGTVRLGITPPVAPVLAPHLISLFAVFCAEPLLVGLRPGHRLAGRPAVALSDLAHDVLGTMPADLFRPGRSASSRPWRQRGSARRRPTSPKPTWPPPAGPTSRASTGSCSPDPWPPPTPRPSSFRSSPRS